MAKKKADVPQDEIVVEEVLDTVIVSQVPVCDKETGNILKMNFYNAAGQLVR